MKQFTQIGIVLVFGLFLALVIRIVPDYFHTRTTTHVESIDNADPVAEAIEVPPDETSFAPPPEKPMEVHRIPKEQWDAERTAKQRAHVVGHFADRDAALKAVDAAINRHGGKGTFSASFGKNGLVVKTDAGGIPVTFE